MDNIQKKNCYACKTQKPLDDFYDDKTKGVHGKASKCKSCTNKRKRVRDIKKHRRYDRAYTLRKKYNLSVERFNEMQAEQEWKCAICKKSLQVIGDKKKEVVFM